MNPKIGNLSNQIRSGKKSGDKFVLMLGAGASLASGVKPTGKIMVELLQTYGGEIQGANVRQRFNQLWGRLSDPQRREYLAEYLNFAPSPGYERLATLLRKGYIDTIITFNFDQLLQKAMVAAGLLEHDEFEVLTCGDLTDERVITLMGMPTPRIKVLKLHGSLSGATFLWTDREMLTYPKPIHDLVEQLTKRPIIICGYGFQDICMVRAFSTDGGPIYCVNPGGIPDTLVGHMIARRSEDLAIDGPDGEFDSFFKQLADGLEDQPSVKDLRPRLNPFKYLESHEAVDADCFFGRDDEVNELKSKIEKKFPVIFMMGPPKSGKTSLLRAGILPALERADEQRNLVVYLRCRGSLEQTLSTQLSKWLPEGAGDQTGLPLLKRLTEITKQHVVVILDQFERVLTQQPAAKGDQDVSELVKLNSSNLTVICVITNEIDPMRLFAFAGRFEPLPLNDLDAADVADIIRKTAERAEITFAPTIVDALCEEYARGLAPGQSRFSLAHVQAICHLLCDQGPTDEQLYKTLIRDERATLELAINRCDIINFIEDVPNLEERSLLRDLIRLVSHRECNEKIVNYVRQHVSGMWAMAASAAAASGMR